MSDLITYNGDHLLEVFKDLNINLGALNPNAVRAWFDTDDQDMKNLLHFMCAGLTRNNIVSAQEISEFQSLDHPLDGTQLDNAFSKVEQQKPGIFEFDLNSKQLEISLAELALLEEEERKLDELLRVDEQLQQTLSNKKLKLERESVELDFKYEEISKVCEQLSNSVDDKNECLHEKLSRDFIALANYHCDESSDFFNKKNLDEIHDSVEFHKSIEELVRKKQEEFSGFFSLSNINLNSTPNTDDPEVKLVTLQNQLSSSYMEYLESQMEVECLSEVNNFLENFYSQDYLINDCIESPTDCFKQKELLLSKLRKKARIVAEEPVILVKISKCQSEFKKIEDNFQLFSQISKYCSKLLSTTTCALMFFEQERKVIEEIDSGARYISKYVLNHLEDTQTRTNLMLDSINSYNDYNQNPLEQRSKILSTIVKLYGETNLKDAYLSSNQLEKNLKTMEHKHFSSNTIDIIDKLYKNNTIQRFLTSGFTNKPIIVPNPVLKSLKNIRTNLDKQSADLKYLLQVSNQTLKKLSSDKNLKNSRLVWVYFLIAPNKLKSFLEQIEEELKRKEIKSVRFKEVSTL